MREPRIFPIFLAGFITLFIIHCAAASPEIGSGSPPPDPDVFWTYITRVSPYTRWSHWPGYEGKCPAISPHGAWLELYANDIAGNAARSGKSIMPYGAILVKENYARDKTTLLSITPMYKVQGFNAAANDWFWAEYSPEGKVRASGRVQSCIRCHSAGPGDYRYMRAR